MTPPHGRMRAGGSAPLHDWTVLGIDLGSSSAKAVVADAEGKILERAHVPQHIDRSEPGAAEQDPRQWWDAIRELTRMTIGRLPPERYGRLAGIAISGHFPTLLLADHEGQPLCPALLYADRRADAEVDLAVELGGEALAGDEWLPKLLWLSRAAPDLLDRAGMVFNPHDYVAFRLTGVRALDHRSARRSGGLFDPASLRWRADLCRRIGLDPATLPPLRRAGEILGAVTPAAAVHTGLPPGVPVVVGMGDTPAELIGAGVVHSGDVLLYYGTTTTVDVCNHDVEPYLLDPRPIVDWAPYRETAYAIIGPALTWAAAGLEAHPALDSQPDLMSFDTAAAQIRPSVDEPYVLPYFLAHGRGGGRALPPVLVGLDAGHSRVHLYRAVLESFGFIARAGLDSSGIDTQTSRFVASGGGAASAVWRQLVSDVLGTVQTWPDSADAAFGSAALAAWGTRAADVFAPEGWPRERSLRRTTPQAASQAIEDTRYRNWLRLRDAFNLSW